MAKNGIPLMVDTNTFLLVDVNTLLQVDFQEAQIDPDYVLEAAILKQDWLDVDISTGIKTLDIDLLRWNHKGKFTSVPIEWLKPDMIIWSFKRQRFVLKPSLSKDGKAIASSLKPDMLENHH